MCGIKSSVGLSETALLEFTRASQWRVNEIRKWQQARPTSKTRKTLSISLWYLHFGKSQAKTYMANTKPNFHSLKVMNILS